MEGAAERGRRRFEDDIRLAWWVERFAREKTLQAPAHYIDQLKPRKPQTPDEILAHFQALQSVGIPVKIQHIRPEEVN